MLSRYNAVEAFKIGFYCEHRTGFHLHEDICHVRVVRPDGETAAPGEQGRVVISNLVNRASVLLNYPIGDLASMSDEVCSCGRTLQAALRARRARVEDILSLADGRFVHPRAVWQVFKADRSVLQYQLTQHELERFELTLTTLDEPAFQRSLAPGPAGARASPRSGRRDRREPAQRARPAPRREVQSRRVPLRAAGAGLRASARERRPRPVGDELALLALDERART